jgi:hypothetical protein
MGGVKNVFVNIFHSFFNIRLLMKNHKQPEDYNMANLDVDRVALKEKKDRVKRMSRQFFGPVLTVHARAELPGRSELIQSVSSDPNGQNTLPQQSLPPSDGSRDNLDGSSPMDPKGTGRKSIMIKLESQIGFIDPTSALFTNAKGLAINKDGTSAGMMDNDDYFFES